MIALTLSISALLIPSLFAPALHRRPQIAAFLDGMVVTAIGGLVVFDILPSATEGGGGGALLAFSAGLVLPALAERLGVGGHAVHGASLLMGQAALLLHSALDGIALATGSLSSASLAFAVVLHQVPVGVAIWLSTAARFGGSAAWACLFAMAATTTASFFAGERLLGLADPTLLGLLGGLAAGTLLHVIAHAGSPGPRTRHAGAGAIAAFAAIFLLHPPGEGPSAPAVRFGELVLASAPALLAGIGLLGLLHLAGKRGVLRGIDLPAALLTAAWMGGPVALVRLSGALAIDRLRRAPAPEESSFTAEIDALAPGVTVGFVAAALIDSLVGTSFFGWLPSAAYVPLLALAGAILPFGAAGMTAVAVALTAGGASLGAALALLLAAGSLSGREGWRGTPRAAAATLASAAVIGWCVDSFWLNGALTLNVLPGGEQMTSTRIACLVPLTALFGASLLRRGPRGWLAQLGQGVTAGAHPHEHGAHAHHRH